MMYKVGKVIYNGETPVYMISIFSDSGNNYEENVLGKYSTKEKNLNI